MQLLYSQSIRYFLNKQLFISLIVMLLVLVASQHFSLPASSEGTLIAGAAGEDVGDTFVVGKQIQPLASSTPPPLVFTLIDHSPITNAVGVAVF